MVPVPRNADRCRDGEKDTRSGQEHQVGRTSSMCQIWLVQEYSAVGEQQEAKFNSNFQVLVQQELKLGLDNSLICDFRRMRRLANTAPSW